MKTLKIAEETHNKLMVIKVAYKLKSLDSTIQMLLDDHDFTNEVLRITKNEQK